MAAPLGALAVLAGTVRNVTSPTLADLATRDTCDVLVAGDTHGNNEWCADLVRLTTRLGLDVVVQLGDFGYWEHTDWGRVFLDDLQAVCAAAGVLWVFIDGNHENHEMLRSLPVSPDGTVKVRDNIVWLPRGFRFNIAGVSFAAFGGAYSIDRRSRVTGRSWWPGEEITDDDLAALGTEQVDVLLTHDMPLGITVTGLTRIHPDDDARSYLQRRYVTEAVSAVKPKLLLHGHWHVRHRSELRVTGAGGQHELRVEGLAADGDPGGWAVLRLADLGLYSLPPRAA